MDKLDLSKLKPITVGDRAIFDKYITMQPRVSCECSFSNLFAWAGKYQFSWLEFDNSLIVYCGLEREVLLPLGETKSPAQLLALAETFRAAGFGDGTLYDIPETYISDFPELEQSFDINYSEADDDYIYCISKLCQLSGKKLRKKRNLIKQFEASYPTFSCNKLKNSNQDAVLDMMLAANQANSSSGRFLEEETDAIKRTFANLHATNIDGVVLQVAGEVIGAALFAPLTHNMYDVMFEKADHNYKGAAQMLTQQVACTLSDECEYLNREQDLGIEGLRRAKRSLDPEFMYKRFTITPKV